MAEFSKQYTELYDPEMPWDFDIEEIGSKLNPGYYKPYICEGFGFIAISKNVNGDLEIYFPDWEQDGVKEIGHWINYERFIYSQKNSIVW